MSFSSTRKTPWFTYISLVAFLVMAGILRWKWNFVGLYGQDAHEYLRFSLEVKSWLTGGSTPGDFFWPLMYPFIGASLSFLTPLDVADSLQLVSVLSIWCSGLLLIQLLKQHRDSSKPTPTKMDAILWVAMAFFLSPYLLRSAFLIMSDALSVLGVTCCYYYYCRYQQDRRPSLLIAIFAGAALAVSTRYVCAILVIAPLAHVLFYASRRGHWSGLLLGAVIGSLFLVPHLMLRWDTPLAFLEHNFMGAWSWTHWLQSQFESATGQFHYRSPNILYSHYHWFHPAYLLVGILLLPWWRYWRPKNMHEKVILCSTILFSLFIAGIPFQNHRFLLPAFPLIIILLFPAFQQLVRIISSYRYGLVLFVLFLGLFQVINSISKFQELIRINQTEQELARRLQQYPPTTLYTFYYDLALGTYDLHHQLINLWAEDEVVCQNSALVLFHPTQFNEQWQGHQLLQNWHTLQEDCQLDTIEQMPNGWYLYRVNQGLNE